MKPAFSIRFRFLVTLLLIVTGVVSVITISMANLFHEDKQTYINDLTSIAALSTAEECRSLLAGYEERLRTFGRVMRESSLPRSALDRLLPVLFQDFSDLVGVVAYEGDQQIAAVFDGRALEGADLTRDAILEYYQENPMDPADAADVGTVVRNSTLSPDLPTLSMLIRQPGEDGADMTLLAMIRLRGLERLATRASVFDVFLVDSEGTVLAHPDMELLRERTSLTLPEQTRQLGGASAGLTVEFEQDGQDFIGGYAGVDLGGVIAGVQIPKSAAYLASREILNRLTLVALVLLLVAAITSVSGSRRLTRPLERLAAATREVAKGRFDIQVPVQSRDEIGSLASSFNQMASELKSREDALDEAQSQLVQSEKMAAFGQLGAGVAHEVKNPLAGILGCVQLSLRKTHEDPKLERNLRLIEKETKRCKAIVENLLRFARQEKAVLEPIDVNPVVEDAVSIVNHQLELNKVSIEKHTSADLPRIQGNANQLQQVLMNLMMNAQQAMGSEGGIVRVSTRRTVDDRVEIRVTDTGPGMPPEVSAKIFEPFFTTKPGGKGTGLGLSVSYGIVRDHGATIQVESEPGDGATFIMKFPIPVSDAEPGDSPAPGAKVPAGSVKSRERVTAPPAPPGVPSVTAGVPPAGPPAAGVAAAGTAPGRGSGNRPTSHRKKDGFWSTGS